MMNLNWTSLGRDIEAARDTNDLNVEDLESTDDQKSGSSNQSSICLRMTWKKSKRLNSEVIPGCDSAGKSVSKYLPRKNVYPMLIG